MARKRESVQQHIPKDLRLQRKVLRRTKLRERRRVEPLLHRAANELLAAVGRRNIVMEDLSTTQEQLLPETRRPDARRRLSVWTQGRFQRIVEYKARTRVVRVNPRGTSSECPRCGGRLDHPEWRRARCADCQGDYHRDRAAATSILSRGQLVLRRPALAPRALHELLEAARWDPERDSTTAPVNEDEAKSTE
jgi:putative transposase